MNAALEEYGGFEVGPIRPPSEAASLLIRLTRNCPWNQCKFCGLYKGQVFSARPLAHVMRDIDQARAWVDFLESDCGRQDPGPLPDEDALWAFQMVKNWQRSGMQSVFLQDANSLVIKPDAMLAILQHLRRQFPRLERITVYGRSHTIARIGDKDLRAYAAAGLNRIHIGMESGSTKILQLVKKGVDKETHILAGKKVKQAGIELSEYYMPGLGGTEYSAENARETADAMNQINPDFIRIRTLAVLDRLELAEDYRNGLFTRTNDVATVRELRLFVSQLSGIDSRVNSDHILNLLEEVEGKLPEDQAKLLDCLESFLALPAAEQLLFRVGRRTGVMSRLADLNNDQRRSRVGQVISRNRIDASNVDTVCDALMARFI